MPTLALTKSAPRAPVSPVAGDMSADVARLAELDATLAELKAERALLCERFRADASTQHDGALSTGTKPPASYTYTDGTHTVRVSVTTRYGALAAEHEPVLREALGAAYPTVITERVKLSTDLDLCSLLDALGLTDEQADRLLSVLDVRTELVVTGKAVHEGWRRAGATGGDTDTWASIAEAARVAPSVRVK